MRTSESHRATAIAEEFVATTESLARVLEAASETEWRRPVPSDGRSVGVVSKHIADAQPVSIGIARTVAAGGRLPTWEAIHEWNAQMAKANADCCKADTLRAVREASRATVVSIKTFTEDELDVTTTNHEGVVRSVADLLRILLVDHTAKHTSDIEKALGGG